MLRFFRKFRQRMLPDNKFSKYLLYAIGEILLVVTGRFCNGNDITKGQQVKRALNEPIFLHHLTNPIH